MFRDSTHRIYESELRDEYEALPASEKQAYEILAQRDYSRAEFLWDELKQLLLRTKGKISYECMRDQLDNIVSSNTIRKWLKMQNGSRLRKDRILPHLDAAAKYRQLVWCHSFWLFWHSAKYIQVERVIMVLVHMDEKWFYTVRNRCNTKVLTSIGLEPADYYCQHKKPRGQGDVYLLHSFCFNQWE